MNRNIAEQIKRASGGGISVLDIVKKKFELLEKHQSCNAVVCCNKDDVFAQAAKIDAKIKAGQSLGRLCGTVITVKDNLAVKGLIATAGMKIFQNNISANDSEAVARLRSEDAIILGKTNMPAGAMDMQTFNPVYGRTNQPDFPEYTCGGSSGGGAAAVKLGISDADIGNDFMGSIRVPSHFCGIYGMIGTDKVIPLDGMVGGTPLGSAMTDILRIGIQAANLQDLQLLFQILADNSKLFPVKPKPDTLKIAYTNNAGGLPISKEYAVCYTQYIAKLSRRHTVTELNPSVFEFQKARDCFLKLLRANMALSMPAALRIMMGSKMSVRLKDYLQAEDTREQCIRQLGELFGRFDVLLSPVTATAAFRHQYPKRMLGSQPVYEDMLIDENKVPYSVANMGYTTPFSLTASPVIVIPIGKDKQGLPFGIQVVGNRYHDLDLIQNAEELVRCNELP